MVNKLLFMTMKLETFIKKTTYSDTYVAHCLLYRPLSRVSALAKNFGFTPSEEEKRYMRNLIAGKLSKEEQKEFQKAS